MRLLSLLGLLCAVLLCSSIASADERPNIVVILCDDLGYGDLECYGHPQIKTPHLNALADQGIRLTDCYSAAPVCSPSRVGLLTGRSPNRAGVYDWIPPSGNKPKPDLRDMVHMRASEVTIPKLLQQAGYATCMSGKWHCNAKFNSPNQPQPGDAGFDHWFGTQNNAAPSHENPNNYVRNGEPVGPLEGFSCQIATSEAIEWMEKQEAQDDQPFFLYLAFHEPHEPVASPEELVAKYRDVARTEDEAHYFANVTNLDLAVGRVIETLEANGEWDNTLIYFSSDNGPETLKRYSRANRSYGTPGPLRGMKLWTTDAGFRVAGIVHFPTQFRASEPDASEVVSSLDLLPTCCELAGIEPPADLALDGTSLVPWMKGDSLDRQLPLIWCYFNAINERRVAMRDGPWKMIAQLGSGEGLRKMQNVTAAQRDEIQSLELSDFQLFQVTEDIGEAEDLTSQQPETAQQMQAKMQQRFEELVENSHYWQR